MLSAQAAQSRRSISWQGQNRTRGQYGSEFQHEPPRQMQRAHGFFLKFCSARREIRQVFNDYFKPPFEYQNSYK